MRNLGSFGPRCLRNVETCAAVALFVVQSRKAVVEGRSVCNNKGIDGSRSGGMPPQRNNRNICLLIVPLMRFERDVTSGGDSPTRGRTGPHETHTRSNRSNVMRFLGGHHVVR